MLSWYYTDALTEVYMLCVVIVTAREMLTSSGNAAVLYLRPNVIVVRFEV